MKSNTWAIRVGLVLLVVASPAFAWKKGISCIVAPEDNSVVYVSRPTHDLSAGATTVHASNFERFVVGPGEHASCFIVGSASSTMEEDAEYHARDSFPNVPLKWVDVDGDVVGNAMFVRTTKVAVVPKVADAPASKPSSGGGGLVVEKNTGQADAAKAWDEQVRAQLRKEAQAQAATLAKAMQADAQRKAEVEKLFEAMRKRGSAQ